VAGRREIFLNRGWKPLPQQPLPRGEVPVAAGSRSHEPLPQDQDPALVVLNAIRWIHDSGCFIVDAAVVMPDHLHLVGQLGDGTLSKVVHSFKSYTANVLSKAGVESPVWQRGYHDHGLRDDEDYRVKVRYVLQNPLRAGLVSRVEDYPYLMLPEWWVG